MAQAIPLIVMAALTAASTGFAVAGSGQSSKAQQSAAKFNAAVASNNALSARQAATAEAERIRQRNRRLAGAQRAAYAKAGVDVSFGSPNDVIVDSGIQGEMDALTAVYTGSTTANNQRARSLLFTAEAESAKSSLPLTIAGQAVGGAASIVGQYGTYKAGQAAKQSSGVTINVN